MERENQIRSLLDKAFKVDYMLLENESHMHSVPENSETHFKLVLVSPDFEGKRKVARHQLVYVQVASLMSEGLHALALHLFTPEEWVERNDRTLESPNCMGGSEHG